MHKCTWVIHKIDYLNFFLFGLDCHVFNVHIILAKFFQMINSMWHSEKVWRWKTATQLHTELLLCSLALGTFTSHYFHSQFYRTLFSRSKLWNLKLFNFNLKNHPQWRWWQTKYLHNITTRYHHHKAFHYFSRLMSHLFTMEISINL